MIKKIFALYLNKKTFFRGSAILALTALLSNLLGLLRDRLLAQHFGAGMALDAYNAAFIVPNLLLNIFVAGALSAAFVPIFTQLQFSKSKTKAGQKEITSHIENTDNSDFVNSALNSSVLIILATGLLVFIFASQLSNWLVPGFNPGSKILFVKLMRLLLLSPLIFAFSNTVGSILISEQKFLWYGLSPALYNVGIIGGTIFLTGKFGIQGVVIGAIAGALFHLVSRLIGLGRYYWHYRPQIKINVHFKKYLRLMLPKIVGQPIEQVMFLGFTVIASTIGTGAIVALNFANNFQTVPVAIIGITFALTAFPVLAKIATQNNKKSFVSETMFTAKTILITTVPAAALIYFFNRPIVAMLIGGGAFNQQAINITAATLAVFAPSIVTESINHLLARAFYALKNSVTPTLIALGGLVITLVSGYVLAGMFGVPGLALGFFFGSVFKIIFHAIFLGRQTKKTFDLESELISVAAGEH